MDMWKCFRDVGWEWKNKNVDQRKDVGNDARSPGNQVQDDSQDANARKRVAKTSVSGRPAR